jgi:glycerol-3-phosphate acyltransferase PlsY
MLELLIKALLGYLCGSLVGGLVLGRPGGGDIRTEGSGNPGGTNALRTRGPAFAAWVLMIDIGKAVFAVSVLPGLGLPGIAPDGPVPVNVLAVVVAAATVTGHVYPLFYEFRGGKGVATLVGCYSVLAPALLLPFALVWIAVVALSGYAGLASMSAAGSAAVMALVQGRSAALVVFAVVMAAFMVFTHRSNLTRMRAGTEHRVSVWPGARQ